MVDNTRIFNARIFMQNEFVANFTVVANVKFRIKFLDEALEWFELTADELQEKFDNDDSFLEEFIEQYHIDILEYEHECHTNYMNLEY